MKRTPPTTRYSQLRYEKIPHERGGRPRVWYLEQELSPKALLKDLLRDIWKLIKWFSRLPGKKEVTIGAALLIGFLPHMEHVSAASLPINPPPHYLQPIKRLEPVTAVQFNVPETVSPIAPPPPVAVSTPAAPVGVVNCGDNIYKQYIYSHESGCLTTKTNSIGCLGIGQSCPASKLLAVCPNLDFVCEDQFFTNYANAVYGGWAGAYSAWLQKHWW